MDYEYGKTITKEATPDLRARIQRLDECMSMERQGHNHDEIRKMLMTVTSQDVLSYCSIHPMLNAFQVECFECVKLLTELGFCCHQAFADIRFFHDYSSLTPERKLCYDYIEEQLPIHPLNMVRLLPLLVAFSSQGKSSVIDPIKNHPLYTKDILRSIMKLAIVSKQELREFCRRIEYSSVDF
jgi:hypothetical protein